MSDHYRALGVARGASPDTVRRAYRDLARRLHPDHQGPANPAERALAERRMRDVNAAWAVLGDPAERRRYDTALDRRARPPSAAVPPPPARPGDEDDDLDEADVAPMVGGLVRALPWVLVLAVLAFIFVFTAYARGGPGGERPADPTTGQGVRVGTCIAVHPGPTTTGVPCGATGALRVVARVSDRARCPGGSEARRLASDRLLDCVRPAG